MFAVTKDIYVFVYGVLDETQVSYKINMSHDMTYFGKQEKYLIAVDRPICKDLEVINLHYFPGRIVAVPRVHNSLVNLCKIFRRISEFWKTHRLDFRRSLVSGLRSSPKRVRGRSAGSFPEQRLVIEPRKRTILKLVKFRVY